MRINTKLYENWNTPRIAENPEIDNKKGRGEKTPHDPVKDSKSNRYR